MMVKISLECNCGLVKGVTHPVSENIGKMNWCFSYNNCINKCVVSIHIIYLLLELIP